LIEQGKQFNQPAEKRLQPVTPRLPAIDLRALLLIEFQTSMTLDG
jgi:hypothetical protein